jgi:hypothetical protein
MFEGAAVGHEVLILEMKMHTKFWSVRLKVRGHSEDLKVDGIIILKYILRKQGAKVWIGLIWLRIRQMVGCCQHGNECRDRKRAENVLTS